MFRKAIIVSLAAWIVVSLAFARGADQEQANSRSSGNDCMSDERVVLDTFKEQGKASAMKLISELGDCRRDNAGLARREWLTGRIESEGAFDKAAIDLFRKAAVLDPNEKEYTKSLIWSLIEAKKLPEARGIAKSAAKKWEQEVEFLELADAPLSSYKTLSKGLRCRLLKEPGNFQLHLDLAKCLIHLRGLDEGFEEIATAVSQAPENIECKIYFLRYVGEFIANAKGAYELRSLVRERAESVLELIGQDRYLLRAFLLEAGIAAPDLYRCAASLYLRKYHYVPTAPYTVDNAFEMQIRSIPDYAAHNDVAKTATYVARVLEDMPKHSFVVMSTGNRFRREFASQVDRAAVQYQEIVLRRIVADGGIPKRIANDTERKIVEIWWAEISKLWGIYDIAIQRYSDGQQRLQFSINYVDNDPVAWTHLSQAAQNLDHRDLAISACNKAVKLAERDAHVAKDAPYWQFMALLQLNLRIDYIESARRAIALKAKDTFFNSLLLQDDLKRADHKQLAHDLEAYVNKNFCPADCRIIAQTGICQAVAADADSDATVIYARILPYFDPTDLTHCAVARGLVRSGRVQEAIKVISTAMEKNPKQAIYPKFRSSLWLIAGNRKNAEQDVRRAITLGDSGSSVERATHVACSLNGSLSEADLELLGRNTRVSRSNSKKVDPLREAEVCITQGHYRKAYDLAKKRLSEGCDRIRAIRIMAMALEASGDKKQAAELRDELVQGIQPTKTNKAR